MVLRLQDAIVIFQDGADFELRTCFLDFSGLGTLCIDCPQITEHPKTQLGSVSLIDITNDIKLRVLLFKLGHYRTYTNYYYKPTAKGVLIRRWLSYSV